MVEMMMFVLSVVGYIIGGLILVGLFILTGSLLIGFISVSLEVIGMVLFGIVVAAVVLVQLIFAAIWFAVGIVWKILKSPFTLFKNVKRTYNQEKEKERQINKEAFANQPLEIVNFKFDQFLCKLENNHIPKRMHKRTKLGVAYEYKWLEFVLLEFVYEKTVIYDLRMNDEQVYRIVYNEKLGVVERGEPNNSYIRHIKRIEEMMYNKKQLLDLTRIKIHSAITLSDTSITEENKKPLSTNEYQESQKTIKLSQNIKNKINELEQLKLEIETQNKELDYEQKYRLDETYQKDIDKLLTSYQKLTEEKREQQEKTLIEALTHIEDELLEIKESIENNEEKLFLQNTIIVGKRWKQR